MPVTGRKAKAVVVQQHHAGMTLVETIVLVAVIMILATMTTPTVNHFLDKRRTQFEQADMVKIREALEGFAEAYNRLPSDTPAQNTVCNTTNNTWNECLALFSDLSPERIATDTWGNDRAYVYYQRTETMSILPNGVDVDYVSVHSTGANMEADEKDRKNNTIDGIAIAADGSFAGSGNGNWWANAVNANTRINEFEQLHAGGDDLMLKFSDLLIKLEKFKKTRTRMQQIGETLASYAAIKKQAQVVLKNAEQDRLIYYPVSHENGGGVTNPKTPAAVIDNNVRIDLRKFNGNVDTVENRDNTALQRQNRLDHMIALMRLLGLPDEFCCDALVKSNNINGDYTQERPFFYYMNPRARINGVCQQRAQSVPFMPATVSRDPRPCE